MAACAHLGARRSSGRLWRMLLGCRARGSGFLRSKVLVHHEPGTLYRRVETRWLEGLGARFLPHAEPLTWLVRA
jgi:hypothetical protein